MNHTELIAKVAEESQLNRAAAGRAVNAVVAAMLDTFSAGGRVRVAGFGVFDVTVRPARIRRNPRTGKTIAVAASRAVRFRPGKAVRNAVNLSLATGLAPPRRSAARP